jgi:hypothetical protein
MLISRTIKRFTLFVLLTVLRNIFLGPTMLLTVISVLNKLKPPLPGEAALILNPLHPEARVAPSLLNNSATSSPNRISLFLLPVFHGDVTETAPFDKVARPSSCPAPRASGPTSCGPALTKFAITSVSFI